MPAAFPITHLLSAQPSRLSNANAARFMRIRVCARFCFCGRAYVAEIMQLSLKIVTNREKRFKKQEIHKMPPLYQSEIKSVLTPGPDAVVQLIGMSALSKSKRASLV